MFPRLLEVLAAGTKRGIKMNLSQLNAISTMVEFKASNDSNMKIIYRSKYAYLYKNGKLIMKDEY